MNILILNGSLGGSQGNSSAVAEHLKRSLRDAYVTCVVESIHLADGGLSTAAVIERIAATDGIAFLTGTYWDSWGSPLQRFLEESTFAEGTSAWLGKPAAVLVTAHSVGAKGVLSRLQGALNTLGCLIPPMTGWAYTASSQQALACECAHEPASHREDFWCLEDLDVIAHNLVTAIEGRRDYRSWPVDRKDPGGVWVF